MMHAFLARCARPVRPDAPDAGLVDAAAAVSDWARALDLAEQHGIAPLIHEHTRAAGVVLPADARSQLQALHVRHRRANEVKLRVLAEILDAFAADGIEARVLKGPALMVLVYGAPALRPTSDLDILVRDADAHRAQRALRRLGFTAPAEAAGPAIRHHLPPATRSVERTLIQVEIHRDALSMDGRASIVLAEGRESPLTFDLHGRTASTLGVHETLWQISEHLVGSLPRPLRLVWIADVVGVAETFADRIDWARVARDYPVVLQVLAFAHALTPLRADVVAHVPAHTRRAQAHGMAAALAWSPAGGVRGQGRWPHLRRTMAPPAWWLDLRYGGAGGPSRWMRRLHHLAVVSRASRRRAEAARRR